MYIFSGDVIAVISDMDSAGYYTAVFEGRCGLIPASFVQEMQMSDKDALHRLLNQVGGIHLQKVHVHVLSVEPVMFSQPYG